MDSGTLSSFADVFKNLDRWRDFPNYQLERRADIFFSLYLPKVLEAVTGKEILTEVVPEFPLRRGFLNYPESPNKSVKVDYLAISSDRSTAYYVELKTDGGSYRADQCEYLTRAIDAPGGLAGALDALVEIVRHTTARRKYFHLLAALERLELIAVPKELYDLAFSKDPRGMTEALARIQVTDRVPKDLVVAYVQPADRHEHDCAFGQEAGRPHVVMGFDRFASAIHDLDDLGKLLSSYLRRWKEPAGKQRPAAG